MYNTYLSTDYFINKFGLENEYKTIYSIFNKGIFPNDITQGRVGRDWQSFKTLCFGEKNYILYSGNKDGSKSVEDFNMSVKVILAILDIYSYYCIDIPPYAYYIVETEGININLILVDLENLNLVNSDVSIDILSRWFDIDFLLGFTKDISIEQYRSTFWKNVTNDCIIKNPFILESFYLKNSIDLNTDDSLIEYEFVRFFGKKDILLYLKKNITDKVIPPILNKYVGIPQPSEIYELFLFKLTNNFLKVKEMIELLFSLPLHYIEPENSTHLSKIDIIKQREQYSLKIYRRVLLCKKRITNTKSNKLLFRCLWYRYTGKALPRDALKRLLVANSDQKDNIDYIKCWAVFSNAIKYLILNSSILNLVNNGYIMIFVDGETSGLHLNRAIFHNIIYPAVLRFRNTFKNDVDAPCLQLTCPPTIIQGKITQTHIGLVIRDDGKLTTFQRGETSIDPCLIKTYMEDWFGSTIYPVIDKDKIDYKEVDEKGKFKYIKNLISSYDSSNYMSCNEFKTVIPPNK